MAVIPICGAVQIEPVPASEFRERRAQIRYLPGLRSEVGSGFMPFAARRGFVESALFSARSPCDGPSAKGWQLTDECSDGRDWRSVFRTKWCVGGSCGRDFDPVLEVARTPQPRADRTCGLRSGG